MDLSSINLICPNIASFPFQKQRRLSTYRSDSSAADEASDNFEEAEAKRSSERSRSSSNSWIRRFKAATSDSACKISSSRPDSGTSKERITTQLFSTIDIQSETNSLMLFEIHYEICMWNFRRFRFHSNGYRECVCYFPNRAFLIVDFDDCFLLCCYKRSDHHWLSWKYVQSKHSSKNCEFMFPTLLSELDEGKTRSDHDIIKLCHQRTFSLLHLFMCREFLERNLSHHFFSLSRDL